MCGSARATSSSWKSRLECSGFEAPLAEIRLHQPRAPDDHHHSRVPLGPPHRVWASHSDWASTRVCSGGAASSLSPRPPSGGEPEKGVRNGRLLRQRLELWLCRAAVGELDPAGAPLHPPAVYTSGKAPRLVVRADTPEVSEIPWVGMARLERVTEKRIDVVGWTEDLGDDFENLAPAVLLPKPMDWEYPTSARELLDALATRGVPWERLLALLRLGSLRRPEDVGMPLIVGTPMRRDSNGELQQHIAAWYFEEWVAKAIRLSLSAYSDHEELRKIGEEVEQILADWADDAKVAWCRIDEMRPQVTERRDSESALHRVFEGRSVSVWGCGAIGGHVAEWLARAGVAHLDLYDYGSVSAGILTRQPYVDAEIGRAKAGALAKRLKAISPDLEVAGHVENILEGPLAREDWHDGADFVIDATAAPAVASKLEAVKRKFGSGVATALGMIFGHTAEHGICVVAPPGHSGGTADLLRQTMLDCTGRVGLGDFANEFWPDPPRVDVFQPEPGCSAPTFRGSGAEVAALAGTLLTSATAAIAKSPSQASGHLHVLPSAPHRGPRSVKLGWETDTILQDGLDRYEVRISPRAHRSMQAWIARNDRASDSRSETGGVLFGRRDPAAGVLWVVEARPPARQRCQPGGVCLRHRGNQGAQRKDPQTDAAGDQLRRHVAHPPRRTGGPEPPRRRQHGRARLDGAAARGPDGDLRRGGAWRLRLRPRGSPQALRRVGDRGAH